MELTIAPPTVGPSAGATEITMAIMPITEPRRWRGTKVMVTVISSGITNAVPAACTTRPASKKIKAGASAAATVPTIKSRQAVINTWRVVKRSMTKPVVGITTAMVSMNPVSSHCTIVAGTWYSAIIAGSATEREVSFKIMMVAATTNTAKVSLTSADIFSGAAAVEAAGELFCATQIFFLN
jgi:hypothetical protein